MMQKDIYNIHIVFEEMGCEVKSLSLTQLVYDNQQIDELLEWADVIYVGGGNTRSMIDTWKKYNLDEKLRHVYDTDSAVLMGLSAGAMCWFDSGYSDAVSGEGNEAYALIDGMLGIHYYALCPHYNEAGRKSFDARLKEKDLVGIALENETAFVDNNGEISFIKSRDDAQAYWIKYVNGSFVKNDVIFREI